MEQQVRVLLIEDDPDFRMLVGIYVEEACGKDLRYVLEGADTVKAGLALLAKGEFDIVLVDLNLPDSRGLETVAKVRAQAPSLPVVVMTNLEEDALGVSAITCGAQEFIPKAKVDSRRLRQTIGFALARNRLFRQLETVIEASPDALIIVDGGRIVRYANAAALALFSRSKESIVGRLFDHPLATAGPSELAIPREGEPDVQAEMRAVEIDWKGAPAWLATIRDVGELKKLEQARAEVRERRRMDELKDRLLSTVAHELRTPLAVVKAVVGTLRDELAGPLTDEQAQLVGTADRHISRLTRLLNNFLDLSRLESRRARVNRVDVDPRALVEEVAGGVRMANASRKIELRVRLQDGLPRVRVDEDMLSQVLGNLLDNAMRYARSAVTVRAVETADAVEVCISDDGPGLPAGGVASLFDKFVQLDRPKGGPGYKGTGLGLAICKESLGLNGGRIWADGEPGAGARFHFTMPLSESLAASPAGGERADRVR